MNYLTQTSSHIWVYSVVRPLVSTASSVFIKKKKRIYGQITSFTVTVTSTNDQVALLSLLTIFLWLSVRDVLIPGIFYISTPVICPAGHFCNRITDVGTDDVENGSISGCTVWWRCILKCKSWHVFQQVTPTRFAKWFVHEWMLNGVLCLVCPTASQSSGYQFIFVLLMHPSFW